MGKLSVKLVTPYFGYSKKFSQQIRVLKNLEKHKIYAKILYSIRSTGISSVPVVKFRHMTL